MNIGVIFAGGSGQRMHAKDKPKQFLMIHGKPIIIHTIEHFEAHEEIDGIIVVCIEEWIPYMKELQYRYRLNKIQEIVPGGRTGQLSIINGLEAAARNNGVDGTIVLIHDGVRPLINKRLISENIRSVREKGTAITCTKAKETVILVDENDKVSEIPARSMSRMAQAPQSFWLKDILDIQHRALADGIENAIDSCSLMRKYGWKLSIVEGPDANIKITTPEDFFVFRALYDAWENQQLEGNMILT